MGTMEPAIGATVTDENTCNNPLRNIKNTYRPRVEARIEAYRGADLGKMAAEFAGKARADNTTMAYRQGVKQYREFCVDAGFDVEPGDPEAIRQFLTYLAIKRGLSMATVGLRFAALRRYYRDGYGRENVTNTDAVRDCVKGLMRVLGERPKHAEPVGVEKLRKIMKALPRGKDGQFTVEALRDKALLLVIYAGALRRSEAAAILRADVVFEEAGVRMLLRSSKGDQQNEGRWIAIGYGLRKGTCPVLALQAWFEASPERNNLFHPVTSSGFVKVEPLTDKGVGRVVKRAAARARLDWEAITAHSLRSGVATDLTSAGLPTALVQERTRHKSANMVARYHHPELYKTNFSRKGGL
jgi:site-specific recombinase XerD